MDGSVMVNQMMDGGKDCIDFSKNMMARSFLPSSSWKPQCSYSGLHNFVTNVQNETNETEIMLVVPPTPMPTMPTSEVKVVVALTGSAAASVPDTTQLKAAMVESLGGTVSADQIQTVVEYEVKQTFTFPAGMQVSPTVAKKAAATTFGVAENMVEVTITPASSRRLQGQAGRRLAGAAVDATIKTTDPVAADTMKATGASTTSVATAFATAFATAHNEVTGNTISAPVIQAAQPTMEMEISYKIVSSSPSATAVVPPQATALKQAFTAQGGTLATVSSTMTVATPAPTMMPTMMPTPLPAGATHMPTNMPTPMPTMMPPTPAPPTPAPPMVTTTAMMTTTATAPKGTESAAFNTKVSGCVAMALTMAMVY